MKKLIKKDSVTYDKNIAKELGVEVSIVFSALCMYQKDNEAPFIVSLNEIVADTCIELDKVNTSITVLSKNNYLEIVKNTSSGKNYYRIPKEKNLVYSSDILKKVDGVITPIDKEKIKAIFKLVDGTEFPIYESQYNTLKNLYTNVNLDYELIKMQGWFLGNPSKRKTKKGIMRFITSWLSKAQDRNYPKVVGYSIGTQYNPNKEYQSDI